MRYLAEIIELDLRYEPTRANEAEAEGEVKGELVGYIDSAYADCLNIRSFTSDYIYFL